jgi:peptide/nickel transport system ATP-binding protein
LSVLEIQNLTFGYTKETKIFNDFSLSLGAGEVKVIVGPSGVGKSTLFELILGRLKPQSGEIRTTNLSVNSRTP